MLEGGREARREGGRRGEKKGGMYQHPLRNFLCSICKHFVLITFIGVKIWILDPDPDLDLDPEFESGF